MCEITKDKLIKDQKYTFQLVCYSIFALVALIVFTIELIMFSGIDFNSIFQISIIILFIVVPFGYLLGIRKMIKTVKNIRWVKEGHIYLEEKQVIDKTMVHADSSNRFCQILFSENDGIWISKKQDKEIRKGDICYVLYIGKTKKPSAVYSKAKYCLSDELIKEGV